MLWVVLIVVALLSLPFFSRRAWRAILPWFKVFWACRVSVVSVAFGLILLAFVPQARDLFAETAAPFAWWVGFFFAMFFGWAFAVHYSARQVLTFDDWAVSRDIPEPQRSLRRAQVRRNYRWPIAYVPRILGLLCFVALGIGISRQRANFAAVGDRIALAREAGEQMNWLLVATVLTGLAFAVFIILRGAFVEGKPRISLADIKASLLAAPREIARTDPLWFRYWFSPSALRKRWAESRHIVLEEASTLGYFAVLVALLATALVNPLWLSGAFARSLVLVAMLGAWVVPLSYVTIWSHYLRAPLLLLLFTILSLTSFTSAGFHDIRLAEVSDKSPPRDERQVSMNEAISQWRRANCVGERLEKCPSPIIVAGQGGASRAAYFLGSVVGRVLDDTRGEPQTYADASKRIFALTTVSGGSLGAIVIRAALEDDRWNGKPETARETPCKRADFLWFGESRTKTPNGWKDCMQAILAGDFLSPAFIGIAFRDNFSIDNPFTGVPLWGDRATLLERSWEERFRTIVDDDRPTGADKSPGLARPLGYLKRGAWTREDGKGWLPLLFLNATSVNTGHRIVASDVKPFLCDEFNSLNALYPQAYDIFELYSWTGRTPPARLQGECRDGPLADTWSDAAPDLRLSTAGAMSARFPIVSPAGRIVGIRDGKPVVLDRVIDGGYFENDGLATALDIAKALQAKGLRPVVVRVTNEPVPSRVEDNGAAPAAPDGPSPAGQRVADATGSLEGLSGSAPSSEEPAAARSTALPRPGSSLTFPTPTDAGIFEPIFSPLIGLYNTRQGHGSEAADAAARLVEDDRLRLRAEVAGLEPSAFIQIQMHDTLVAGDCNGSGRSTKPGKIPEVSMSWWLSQPVQAYLDAQVCNGANADSYAALLDHLKRKAVADLTAQAPEGR